MLVFGNVKEANMHMADSLEKTAGGKNSIPCQKSAWLVESADDEITEGCLKTAWPGELKSALLDELDGGEISEDLQESAMHAKSDDSGRSKSSEISNWRKPFVN